MESISGGPCDRSTIRVDALLVTAERVDKRQQIDSTLHGCSVARQLDLRVRNFGSGTQQKS